MIISYYPISTAEIESKISKRIHYARTPINSNIEVITNEFGEKLTRIDGEIPTDLEIKKGQRFLFISYDQSKYTHGLHKYPAKFFPELPRWLINRYSKKFDTVLDPFMGSGTANIEALLNKRHSVGIDIDPFAKYLTKVKTTLLDRDEIEYGKNKLLKKVERYKPPSLKHLPEFPYRDNWFTKEMLLELAYLKRSISMLDVGEDSKDFFCICMSSIIRAVSNADNNCTRTVVRKKLKKQIYPSFALTKFTEALIKNTHRINDFLQACPEGIDAIFPDDSDARYIPYDEKFTLALTSPPYVNAVDYPRTHQLEMYWLGLANGSLAPLKRLHIGTEVVNVEDYKELHTIGDNRADRKIRKIYKKDPRRAYIAYKYLKDMKANISEVYKALKPGGKYALVVGNNRIRGELFENWQYLMPLAEEIGFNIETYFGSEIIKHFIKVPREERIETDWIIILSK